MNYLVEIYNLIFFHPILKTLNFFSKTFNDFGLAIIFLTFLIKILLFPLDWSNLKFQKKMTKIQKEIKEIEKKFTGKEKIEKIISLYQREKINPFFNFFTLFLQFPILIAIYQVILKIAKEEKSNLSFFNLIDLSKNNISLALLVGLVQFFSFKNPAEKRTSQDIFSKTTSYFFPFFTFLILSQLPSALSVYLLFNFLFLKLEQEIIYARERKNKKHRE